MVLSNVSNLTQDQRIRNLLGARKRYSDYTKEQCRNGAKEKAALRSSIEQNQKEIVQIKTELEKYRREYNKIIRTIGRAHEEAVFQENEEDIVSDLIRERNKRVKSRAELVLLEEIHRSKLLDLKKQLEKEKILKRRRDIFRMRSPPPKLRVGKEFQEKLDEWKQFEELVQQEINQLREEKEQTRLKNVYLETNRDETHSRPVKPAKVIPKVYLKPKIIKNVQVQTEIATEPKELESPVNGKKPTPPQKVSSSSQVTPRSVPSSLIRPTVRINQSLENLLALRIAEKLNKMKENVTTEVTKITKDAAINTTSRLVEEGPSISDLSQTCYLPLPSDKKQTSNSIRDELVENDKFKGLNEDDDIASSTLDLSVMSGINLKELVQKIQNIKNLVNKSEPVIEIKTKRPVVEKVDAVVSSMNQTFDKSKVSIIDEYRISPVSSISPSLSPTRSLSPTQSDSPPPSPVPSLSPLRGPGLSGSSSSPCLSSAASSTSSDATIKRIESEISLADASIASLPDHETIEQGRFNDDTSSVVLPRSLQLSIDFSQFSQLLNVDKDKLWSDVLNLAGVNKSSTFIKTPQRKISRKFTQSTPKERPTKGSVVFDCLTNQVTLTE